MSTHEKPVMIVYGASIAVVEGRPAVSVGLRGSKGYAPWWNMTFEQARVLAEELQSQATVVEAREAAMVEDQAAAGAVLSLTPEEVGA